MYVHEPCVFISITPHTCITTASKYIIFVHCYVYVHEPCVFFSITPHLSIIPASLQEVSTLCTLICVCTLMLCLHFYHASSITNTCIIVVGKYILFLHCYVYINLVSSFLSHLIYISLIPASIQQVSTLFTLLCVCTLTLCHHFYHTSSINNIYLRHYSL